jgi:uncharacterized protein YggU (UPF0235/DUF167 family)
MKEQRNLNFHDGKSGAAITVRVTPRSSQNEISEVMNDGTIKIHLKSLAGEQQVNEALIQFLAEILELPVSRLEIVAGQTGKDKLITVDGAAPAEVHNKILRHLV